MLEHSSMLRRPFLVAVVFFALVSATQATVHVKMIKDGDTTLTIVPDLGAAHEWLLKLPNPLPNACIVEALEDEAPSHTLTWTKSGRPEHPVIIRGVGTVTLHGNRIKDHNYGKPVLVLSYVSHVIVENLTFYDFDGSRESRTALAISGRGHNIIRNCRFNKFYGEKTEAAISVYNTSHNIIEHCTFDSLGDDIYIHALYLNKNASHNIIRNNVVNYCSGEAFMVRNGSNFNIFDGNVIKECSGVAFYGEWYNKQADPPEKPSRGNVIKNAKSYGPGKPLGYVKGRYIRKVRAMDWAHYTRSRKDEDLGDSTRAYYMPKDANNEFFTLPQDMEVEINPVVAEDPASIVLINNLLYHGQTEPSGWIEGARIDLMYSDTTNRWGGTERYLRQVQVHDSSDKPRRYRTPLKVLSLEGDVVAEFVPERQLAGRASRPFIRPITGADQVIHFQIDSLQSDYDLFLLPQTSNLNKKKLEQHFRDEDGGWRFFYKNALKYKKGWFIRFARSCNKDLRSENFSVPLKENKTYFLVVCARGSTGGFFRWRARPI